jgi:hypothetical protein
MIPTIDQVKIDRVDGPDKPQDCPVCVRLRNLWLTGEWTCPRCKGPSPEMAARLRVIYSTAR